VRDEVLTYLANSFDDDGRGLLIDDPEANFAAALDVQSSKRSCRVFRVPTRRWKTRLPPSMPGP
jgi:hypothetical protein